MSLKSLLAPMTIAAFAWATMATACTVEDDLRCKDAYFQTVNTICPLSFDPALCREGALLSYSNCKENAGCRD